MLTYMDVIHHLTAREITFEVQKTGLTGQTIFIPNFAHRRLSIYCDTGKLVECSGFDFEDRSKGDGTFTTRFQIRQDLFDWLDKKHNRINGWPSVVASLQCRGCRVENEEPYGDDGLPYIKLYTAFAPDGTLLHLVVDHSSGEGKLSWQDRDEFGEGVPCTHKFSDEWQLRDFLRDNWPIRRENAHQYELSDGISFFAYSYHANHEVNVAYPTPWMYSRPQIAWDKKSQKFMHGALGMTHADCPAQAFRAWWWLRKLLIGGFERGIADAIITNAIKMHGRDMLKKNGDQPPNPYPMREHILEHLRMVRSSANYIALPYELYEKKREDGWRSEFAADVRERLNWRNLESMLKEAEPDEADGVCRVYVTSVFNLAPSGKYYTPWANSNVTEAEARKDEIFWEVFEEVIHEKLGPSYWSEPGEGDPTDIFICKMSDKQPIEAEE